MEWWVHTYVLEPGKSNRYRKHRHSHHQPYPPIQESACSACHCHCWYSSSQNMCDIFPTSYLNQKADSTPSSSLSTSVYQVSSCQPTWDVTGTCTKQGSEDQARGDLSSWPQLTTGSRVDEGLQLQWSHHLESCEVDTLFLFIWFLF